jgi:hypothetical protein
MMPGLSARPRDLDAPAAREHKTAPAREQATKSKNLDEAASTDESTATGENDAIERDEADATRSVQDLIAAAMKMFANTEETIAPAAQVQVTAPAVQIPRIEDAVQQVLDQIVAKPEAQTDIADERKGDLAIPDGMTFVEPEVFTDAPMTSKGPVATTAVREPAPLPENPNPSHVNLVLEDGAERVVVTVAVRGNEVHAMLRGGDEQTAASLARNAASLDHALRAGGLDLASFQTERDPDHHASREPEHRERETQQDVKFTLDEEP